MTNTYLICTTARSGSNLFCDFCTNTRVLGRPIEAFNPDIILLRSKKTGDANSKADGVPEINFSRYLLSLLATDVGKNGVFGTKLLFEDFEHYIGFKVFRDLFLNSTRIHLRRRSKIRQAVSYFFAAQTGQWLATDPATKALDEVVYDFDAIASNLNMLVRQDTNWTNLLSTLPERPLEIYFEDFLAEPKETLELLANAVGVSPLDFPVRSNIREQRNHLTDEFVDRFQLDWQRKTFTPRERVFYKHTWFI